MTRTHGSGADGQVADGRSYGDHLREARERKGIDLVSMARTLHIRPDIVGAIENADFNKMPAHGYSKNMVRAYARHVGLDEVKISQMYADERDMHDGNAPRRTGRRREDAPRRSEAASRSVRVPSDRSSREARTSDVRRPARSQSVQRGAPAARRRAERERTLDRRTPEGRGPRQAPTRTSRGGFSDLVASIGQGPARKESHVRSSFTQGGPRSSYVDQLNRGRTTGGIASRLPALNLPVLLAIGGAIAIIVAAVILFNGGDKSVNEVPDIPISGLTDTSATDENAQIPQVQAAPSSVMFSFSVADGQASWITIYENGGATPIFAEVAEGPVTKDFEVTGTLTFETANITPITLTVDGEEVKATPAQTGTNYVYTVDFPAYLAQWKIDHGVDDDGGDDSSSSAASSSSGGSSSSSASTTDR